MGSPGVVAPSEGAGRPLITDRPHFDRGDPGLPGRGGTSLGPYSRRGPGKGLQGLQEGLPSLGSHQSSRLSFRWYPDKRERDVGRGLEQERDRYQGPDIDK